MVEMSVPRAQDKPAPHFEVLRNPELLQVAVPAHAVHMGCLNGDCGAHEPGLCRNHAFTLDKQVLLLVLPPMPSVGPI